MDFLEKLNYLMDKKQLNKNSLSKSCDIPYTTIDGWYKKGYEGLKVPTLKKLSIFFNVSLDYWVSEVNEPSEWRNKELLSCFKKLNPELQDYIILATKNMVATQENMFNNQEGE